MDDQLRDYAELSGALDELEASHGWTVFADRLRFDAGPHRKSILSGRLDQEKYRFECGWLEGMFAALETPERVRAEYQVLMNRKAEEEDEAGEDE